MNAKDRERRFRRLKEIGCVACRMEVIALAPVACEIHHLNLGGRAGQKRRGDDFTIPLCAWHHRGDTATGFTAAWMREFCGPSLARQSKAFRARYGTDDELLEATNKLIAKYEAEAA